MNTGEPKAKNVLAQAFALAFALSSAAIASACSGCRSTNDGQHAATASADNALSPTVRVFAVSDLAGALEPCGCTKDQLGGVNHFASWLARARESTKGGASLFVASGSLFFMEPTLDADHASQDMSKAETIAASMKELGLTAFAPGRNDWAAGSDVLAKLRAASGAEMLAANADGSSGAIVRDVGGVKIGIIGVSAADKMPNVAAPTGVTFSSANDAVKKASDALTQQGVKVQIVLAAIGRGEAKRLAEIVPNVTAIVVGAPGEKGDTNDPTPPGERVGDVLIVQSGNHLTTAAEVDLFVRDGSFTFADASGLDEAAKRAELTARIDDLHTRIAAWQRDGNVTKADMDARRADVKKLEAERARIDVKSPPANGSFFRYTTTEMRESLGADPRITSELLAYYKTVNDANKVALANRLPRPAGPKEASFVGIDACSACHEPAREVWNKTKHAGAYATLSTQFKEFNLDCVSCHVTGYEQPGGSTVVHVEKLQNVQCEDCHGAGSLHAAHPDKVQMPIAHPGASVCLSCHHPPHVDNFDALAKMNEILGPGHGRGK